MSIADPQSAVSEPNIRWFHPTPDRLVIALLAPEGCLLLSQWFGWLPKGWPVLIAIATVAVVMLLMLLWFAVALLFGRRFQFSIRSLLVLVVVVAVPCSWMSVQMKKAREQKEAIEKLKRPCTYAESANPLSAPPWLRNILGDDFFGAVDTVNVGEGSLTDAQLEHLGAFDQLRVLRLSGCFPKNTDAGLKNLECLSQLEELSLDREHKVTDAGLEHLKNLILLRRLDLGWTKITDAGLQHLDKLIHLESLNISNTPITDVGIERLARLPKLESLDIRRTRATEAVLAHLKDWPKLRRLRHDFPLGDRGLALLSRFPQLRNPEEDEMHGEVHLRGVTDEGMTRIEVIGKPEFLCIDRARITAGWNHLDRMPSVEGLDIKDTMVNREGMAAISRIPKLRGLRFDGAQITAGWEYIAQIKGLEPISSDRTIWHPDGLAALSRHSWVEGRICKSDGMTLSMIGRSCGPRVHELFLYPSKVGLNFADCGQYPQYMPFVIDCQVRGPDMAALADFSSVKLLEIDDESLAAAALPYVQAMPNLKELRLCCPMAFAGMHVDRDDKPEVPIDNRKPGFLFELLREPSALKNLRGLAINVPSDEHLAFLAKLPQLECLRLYHDRKITDAGLEHLKGLPNLHELSLTGTKITDVGLERLKVLTSLRHLDLDRTQVSDAGLEHLRGMGNLKWLYLVESRVTDVGVKKLQQALPNCRIIK